MYVPGHSTVAFSAFLSLDCKAILSLKFQRNNPLSSYRQEGNSYEINFYFIARPESTDLNLHVSTARTLYILKLTILVMAMSQTVTALSQSLLCFL